MFATPPARPSAQANPKKSGERADGGRDVGGEKREHGGEEREHGGEERESAHGGFSSVGTSYISAPQPDALASGVVIGSKVTVVARARSAASCVLR
jgi:hypothetical protein